MDTKSKNSKKFSFTNERKMKIFKKKKLKNAKQNKVGANAKNQAEDIKKFKQKYFDYYDDVKDYTKGKEDW